MATLKIRKVTSLPVTLEPSCMYLINADYPGKLKIAVTTSDGLLAKHIEKFDISNLTKSGINGFSLLLNGNIYTTSGKGGYKNSTTGLHYKDKESIRGINSLQPIPEIWSGEIIKKGNDYYTYNYILTDTNELWTWGYNQYGQCGVGHDNQIDRPVLVANDVLEVYDHVSNSSYNVSQNRLFIKRTDGYIYGCGYDNGSLGLGNNNPVAITNFTQISALGSNTVSKLFNLGSTYGCVVVLTTDGRILVAGKNDRGQLGAGTTTNINTFTDVTSNWTGVLNGILDIKVSGGFGYLSNSYSSLIMMITMPDGSVTVKTCGSNTNGQLGNGTTTDSNIPVTPIGLPINIKDIACVSSITMQLLTNNGDLWTWGYNGQGQLGNGSTTDSNVPILVRSGVNKLLSDGWTTHYKGNLTPIFIEDLDNSIHGVGYNNSCALGLGIDGYYVTNYNKVLIPDSEIIKELGYYVTSGNEFIMTACSENGNLYTWGDDKRNGIYNNSRKKKVKSPVIINFYNIFRE